MNLLSSIQRKQMLIFIFVALSAVGDAYSKLPDAKGRGTIYDLRVNTTLFDKDTLQANISWKLNGFLERKIDVRLNPRPNEHCSNKPCVVYGLPSNTTDILLPRDPMPMLEHRECMVEPGCSYDVFVETTDRKIQQTTQYTVPDCVSDVCSCKHSHLLPSSAINATIVSKMLNIFWNITVPSTEHLRAENIFLDNIEIIVGIQNNPSLTWGGQYKNIGDFQQPLYDANGRLHSSGFNMVNLSGIIDNEMSFRLLIRAHVVDNKGCHGNDSNFTYSVIPRKANVVYASSNFVWIFIVCSSTILMLLAAGFVFAFRHMQKRLHKEEVVKNWRGIYQNVPASGLRPAIPFQENYMYGDDMLLSSNRSCYEDEFFEIPHASLKFSHNIGKGAFGSVYLAQADNIGGKDGSQMVAVKKLKKNSTIDEMEEFFCEISMMKTVSRHPNIVSLIGYCTVKKPMLMVMEYVGCGDLLNYLRRLRHRHEVRSVVVSDNARLAQAGSSQNLMLPPNNNNSNNNPNVYYNASNALTSNNTSTTNLSNNTNVHLTNNLGPVGKYLELIHSPMNSSSSGTANSDASYVTRAESIPSAMRASEAEINYTLFGQNNEGNSIIDYALDSKELHSFAIQIARGMRHLEEKGITHRDLAARNILIDENKLLKISDFGLSRTGIYVNTRNKKVPLRWLAVEALRDHLYSTKSDVWSFGIVLWEIGTLGGMPYPNVSNAALLSHLLSGNRMQRPEICSEQLYQLMRQCWLENPDSRPFFSEIVDKLESNSNDEPIYVNFDELAPNYAFPPTVEDVTDKKNFGEFGETDTSVLDVKKNP